VSSPTEPRAPRRPRDCPITNALSVVGDRWSLLVLRELVLDVHRFVDIQANTGAPRETLSARLAKLVEHGVIERRSYSAHPPRDEYHLTEAGRLLTPVLRELRLWGERQTPAGAGTS
jgi:DNA-binding HxlR family transcriptional regulator